MDLKHIRNFSIIAHIDHGKSTLADRMLEITKTIEVRKMRDQVLDSMELERERGITIKMQPVRMEHVVGEVTYEINLIDTPGHIDFSYEVSRALKAVEGVLLLVDSTQGVQAQTLTTLAMAQAQGCVIIPVVSKIDSPAARVDVVSHELAKLVGVSPDDVIAVSGKTGVGVDALLEAIATRVPPPHSEVAGSSEPRGLVFDFSYSKHRGVAVYLRVFDGVFKKGQPLSFRAAGKEFIALETGIFTPEETPADSLSAGEIGYIVTGIKEAGVVAVGDTIGAAKGALPALADFERPRPVVWASVYPENQDDLPLLRQSLERLRLSDSSLSFEEESSGVLGRGFRCGFLGLLHLEIVTERLRREFGLKLIVTIPTISYVVTGTNGVREVVYTPARFPEHGDIIKIEEPWAKVIIITPPDSLNTLIQLLYEHEANTLGTETYQNGRIEMTVKMPLRELMRGFFDKLKNISSGYASLSYEVIGFRPTKIVKIDVMVAEEIVPAFSSLTFGGNLAFKSSAPHFTILQFNCAMSAAIVFPRIVFFSSLPWCFFGG